MNRKFFLQFIVYLLSGIMAMAGAGLRTNWHDGDIKSYVAGSTNDSFIADHDEEVNYSYNTRKKQSFLRLRFRAETSFRSEHNNISKLVNAVDPATAPVLYIKKTAHLPPFYYLFLFRLTPF